MRVFENEYISLIFFFIELAFSMLILNRQHPVIYIFPRVAKVNTNINMNI